MATSRPNGRPEGGREVANTLEVEPTMAPTETSLVLGHQSLVEADEQTLIDANVNISQSGTWGSFAFLPVTDGSLIQSRPSEALKEGKINGINHLAGHNALEGAAWVPRIITTINDLSNSIMFEIELKGLGSAGQDSQRILRRAILGYNRDDLYLVPPQTATGQPTPPDTDPVTDTSP